MPKQGNNHGATPCSNRDDRAVEQVFLRLGNVLAEIAKDIERKEANISQNIARDRDDISASQNEKGKA